MTQPLSLAAIVAVCVATLAIGSYGLRISRATSDFYVAGRQVTPWRNASAISGEYLSAASFLGVAGLVYSRGIDMLWFPIGYTMGYLVLLVLIAAPLRRSGAYTLADFAELRLESRRIRGLCSALVVGIGWFYLIPQLQGAGIALRQVTGWPTWVGGTVVSVVVALAVSAGGMRSITLVQAMQYWVKVTAISLPAFILLAVWRADPAAPSLDPATLWVSAGTGPGSGLYATYSTLLALCLGTMGLPHVLVRFYTNPDGRDARRTTVVVLGLLGMFYLFPPVYAALGRAMPPACRRGPGPTGSSCSHPTFSSTGPRRTSCRRLLAGGAFAAFLSTASGLAMSVAGILDQDVARRLLPTVRRGGSAFGPPRDPARDRRRPGVVPLVVTWLLAPVGLASTVGLAFAVAASTFAPLLALGVWWPRLTTAGATAGLIVGSVTASLRRRWRHLLGFTSDDSWLGAAARPAGGLVGAPGLRRHDRRLAADPRARSRRTRRATMARLHTPESLLPP
jgi:cation/acetate symporter